MTNDHSFPGIEYQGHRSRSWVGVSKSGNAGGLTSILDLWQFFSSTALAVRVAHVNAE